jgi:hypothetical protein
LIDDDKIGLGVAVEVADRFADWAGAHGESRRGEEAENGAVFEVFEPWTETTSLSPVHSAITQIRCLHRTFVTSMS